MRLTSPLSVVVLLPAMVHRGIIQKKPVVHSFGALCLVRDGLLNIMLLQQINGVLPNLSQLGSPCVQYYKGQCLGGNTVGMAGAPMVWTVKVQAAPPSSQSGASGAYYQSHQAMWWYTVHQVQSAR